MCEQTSDNEYQTEENVPIEVLVEQISENECTKNKKKRTQKLMSMDRIRSGHPTPLPGPGTYARHNAIDMPALTPAVPPNEAAAATLSTLMTELVVTFTSALLPMILAVVSTAELTVPSATAIATEPAEEATPPAETARVAAIISL